MIIEDEITVDELIMKIDKGQRHFYGIDFGEGEAKNKDFDNITFEECIMSIDFSKSTFRNSKFVNSNIKCCIFNYCDLTNLTIENCSVESLDLKDSILDGMIFNNNYCYGVILNQKDLGSISK